MNALFPTSLSGHTTVFHWPLCTFWTVQNLSSLPALCGRPLSPARRGPPSCVAPRALPSLPAPGDPAASQNALLPDPSLLPSGCRCIRPLLVTSLPLLPPSGRTCWWPWGALQPGPQGVPPTPAPALCPVATPGCCPHAVRARVSLDSLATRVRPLRTEVQCGDQDCACVLPPWVTMV